MRRPHRSLAGACFATRSAPFGNTRAGPQCPPYTRLESRFWTRTSTVGHALEERLGAEDGARIDLIDAGRAAREEGNGPDRDTSGSAITGALGVSGGGTPAMPGCDDRGQRALRTAPMP